MSGDPAGLPGRLKRIAGLGHNAGASTDAWSRILAFFGEHLAEPAA